MCMFSAIEPHLSLSLAALIFDFFDKCGKQLNVFHTAECCTFRLILCVFMSAPRKHLFFFWKLFDSDINHCTSPASPCYNYNTYPQHDFAVTLQRSHSSFPPCWRKTELVKKHIKSEMSHFGSTHHCHSDDESLLSQHTPLWNPPD